MVKIYLQPQRTDIALNILTAFHVFGNTADRLDITFNLKLGLTFSKEKLETESASVDIGHCKQFQISTVQFFIHCASGFSFTFLG